MSTLLLCLLSVAAVIEKPSSAFGADSVYDSSTFFLKSSAGQRAEITTAFIPDFRRLNENQADSELLLPPQDRTWNFRPNTDVILPKQNIDNVRFTVLTLAEAQLLLRLIQKASYVPWTMIEAGCQFRAYEMSRILKVNGVSSGRIWIYPDGDGSLGISVPWVGKGIQRPVGWNFHTTPIVMIKSMDSQGHEKITEMVLDPAFDKANPLTLKQWTNKFAANDNFHFVRTDWTNLIGTTNDANFKANFGSDFLTVTYRWVRLYFDVEQKIKPYIDALYGADNYLAFVPTRYDCPECYYWAVELSKGASITMPQ